MEKKRIKTAEELLKVVEHCKEDGSCRACEYFRRSNSKSAPPCMSAMLQDIYDFIMYHKAILAEAERRKGDVREV